MVRPLLGHGTEPSFLQWLPVLGSACHNPVWRCLARQTMGLVSQDHA